MKASYTILTGVFLTAATALAAGDKTPGGKAPQGPPPPLENVIWDGRPLTLGGLRGKTVIVLAYATWCDELNSDAGDMFRQLKESIKDQPVVVLAINCDKKAGAGPAFLKKREFAAPNIVSGWDPLMPARWGAKTDLFQYARVNPAGQAVETGYALSYYETNGQRQYVLSRKLAGRRKLGNFTVLDSDMTPAVRNLLWPLELQQPVTETELTAARRSLSGSESKAIDAAVDRYLDARVRDITKLAEGNLAEKLSAYDQAAQLTSAFKSHSQLAAVKDLAAQLNRDKGFRAELAAKRAYEKARQQAAKSPVNRGHYLMNVSRAFKGTLYGQKAAEEMDSSASSGRPKSVHTWPELTAAQQETFLKQQRDFLEEVRGKVPGHGLKSYETDRFLFFSDFPPNVVTALYLPYLDQMYTQLCWAFGLDPQKNIWKGKATIVAYINEQDFIEFERTFYREPAIKAQGVANCQGDGTVRIACYAGRDPSYFAALLVHETTHGFEWRYRSGDDIPSWLNEGTAEWSANRVVSTDKGIRHKVERAVRQMQQTHSLGGDFFTAQQISEWQYGVAASMVDFLINYDPASHTAKSLSRVPRTKLKVIPYRKLIDGIKDGLPWETALYEAYGMTPEQLTQAYGQWMGIPDLRP